MLFPSLYPLLICIVNIVNIHYCLMLVYFLSCVCKAQFVWSPGCLIQGVWQLKQVLLIEAVSADGLLSSWSSCGGISRSGWGPRPRGQYCISDGLPEAMLSWRTALTAFITILLSNKCLWIVGYIRQKYGSLISHIVFHAYNV